MTTYVRFTKDLEKPEHLAAKKDACKALEDRTARKLINAGYAYELPHDKAVQVFGLEEPKPVEPEPVFSAFGDLEGFEELSDG